MAETRPSVDTAAGKVSAMPVYDVTAAGAAVAKTLQDVWDKMDEVATLLAEAAPTIPPGELSTDTTLFPTHTAITVTGADTDELLAPTAAKRTFVYGGWLQTDIDVVVTLKVGANAGASVAYDQPITLKAGEVLIFESPKGYPDVYTGVAEGLYVTKSTAATLKGALYSKTA